MAAKEVNETNDANESDEGYGGNVPVRWDGALQGARLYLAIVGIALPLFLTGIEATIVSTSLVTITDDLQSAGFLIVWASFSNIFGVKPSLLTAVTIFIAFSGGCAGAQSISQLIICRAFQGLGGAGIYSLSLFSILRLLPYEQYDKASSLAGGILSIGLVIGPLLGGAISNDGKWRWVFLLNVPAAAVGGLLIFFILPAHFPNAAPVANGQSTSTPVWAKVKAAIHQVDFLGAFLVLTACSFIIAALQEGNYEYSWGSGLVVSFLVISGISWILFVGWEWLICRRDLKMSPMFPWRLTQNRLFMGIALGFFTTGVPLTVCVIEIPQRFQIVNGSSPVGAGVKLLSFALSCLVGIISCSVLAGRLKIPFAYIAVIGLVFQVIGLFLFSEIEPIVELWPGQFGYLVLAGLGCGLGVSAFYMATSLVVDIEDQSIALGIGIQLRMLGGVLGIATSSAILFHYIQSRLSSTLSPGEMAALLKTTEAIETFSPENQLHVREVYAIAYNMEMKMCGAFAAAQALAVAMIWKRDNVRFSKS
ncbi:major facilitator superfamily domain-containing protein [Penicillium brevicompactum]|uniref:Major facilitator superfamily domain-containing protein n=1 Tax=Penicillium brevicompactum TaxID=5074 RepID=A0A9W9Q9G4_PENBR|nr:major facilitator superfamily domain-containing protein [Penicillium brevicompactum]